MLGSYSASAKLKKIDNSTSKDHSTNTKRFYSSHFEIPGYTLKHEEDLQSPPTSYSQPRLSVLRGAARSLKHSAEPIKIFR